MEQVIYENIEENQNSYVLILIFTKYYFYPSEEDPIFIYLLCCLLFDR